MTVITNGSCRNMSVWINYKPCYGRIGQAHSQPAFWWKLECAADEVSNHICMADDQLKTVFFLFRRSAMNVLAERCFNSRSVSSKMQKRNLLFNLEKNTYFEHRTPAGMIRLWWIRSPFFNYRVTFVRDLWHHFHH